MAILPKIAYNFNENSATTIRDYSENGNDGSSATVSTAVSTRIGYDLVFNDAADTVDIGNITDLNGADELSLHISLLVTSDSGSKYIFSKSSQIVLGYNYTASIIVAQLYVNSGTAQVSASMSLNSWHDVVVTYSSGSLKLYIDGVEEDEDTTETGVIDSNANTMYLGNDTSTDSAIFRINELKLYDVEVGQSTIDAWVNEQNGVLSSNIEDGEYVVGDILAANIENSPVYAICSFVDTDNTFRFYPITDGIIGGMNFRRVGNLFNTDRQDALKLSKGQICFYDGVSLSSEVFDSSKKTFCVNKYGIIRESSTKTANYTVTSSDQRIYVDSSGGAFTITLEASPTTNREIELIDKTGDCIYSNVTIDGNGNNILDDTTIPMDDAFWSCKLIFNGTLWNLI